MRSSQQKVHEKLEKNLNMALKNSQRASQEEIMAKSTKVIAKKL